MAEIHFWTGTINAAGAENARDGGIAFAYRLGSENIHQTISR
jgi:hypothetical protein